MAVSQTIDKFFKRKDPLPDPKGLLSLSIPPRQITAINKAVSESLKSSPQSRGEYVKLSDEEKAEIARYAVENGNTSAAKRYSNKLGKQIKESSISVWVKKMKCEQERKRKAGDTDLSVRCLPNAKRGRPLMLGKELDSKVQQYIRSMRDEGAVVTTPTAMSIATAVVETTDRTQLSKYGGPIDITTNWAKSLLYRMKFVKRRGGSTKKLAVVNFDEIKEQFLLDVAATVIMREIPFDLILNWDQTALHIVPGSTWTLEKQGTKRVEIAGIDDKHQVTLVICGSLSGKLLPFQVIYTGTTSKSLPKNCAVPSDWHLTMTHNHWSNEEKMKEYLQLIFIPYIQQTRKALGLAENHPALAIYDVFKGQCTDAIYDILDRNNIYIVKIPANCTDRLQPMDLSINKAVTDFMRGRFMEWYSNKVMDRLVNDGEESSVNIDFKLTTMKPLVTKWMVQLFDYLSTNPSITMNGFKAAGINEAISMGMQND